MNAATSIADSDHVGSSAIQKPVCFPSARFVLVTVEMDQAELRGRAKQFAERVLRFVRTLPRDCAGDAVARQLARSACSVSANYRAAGRGRSRAEFIAKLAIVLEEADETEHWLDVIHETELASGDELERLRSESRELRAIFAASVRTARRNHEAQKARSSKTRKPRHEPMIGFPDLIDP